MAERKALAVAGVYLTNARPSGQNAGDGFDSHALAIVVFDVEMGIPR